MYDFGLIIPCFNEKERVTQTANLLASFFSSENYWRKKKVCIVFVNDGSSDETAKLLDRLPTHIGDIDIQVVSYFPNKGKGMAIKQGVSSIDANIFGFIDADLPFELSALSSMHTFCVQNDCVVGKRVGIMDSDFQNKTFGILLYIKFRLFISKFLRKLVKHTIGLTVEDTQCGVKLFSKEIARQIFPLITESRFSFDVELLTRVDEHNLKIKEFPLIFRYDKTSQVRLSDGVRFILDIVGLIDRLRGSPSRSFFVMLGILSLLIVSLVFGWTLFLGFFFSDDFTWLWHGWKIDGSLKNILSFRMSTFYSPVLNAFYTYLYPIFKFSSHWYFLVGLLIHTLVAWFSGLLVFLITRSRSATFITTILIAFAGSAYEPLVWIGANMHSIAGLFILFAILSYARFLHSGHLYNLIISFVVVLFAFGTKEIAIILPILLIIIYLFSLKNFTRSINLFHLFYWLAIILTSSYYAFMQYEWQKQSVWIAEKIWSLSFVSLARIPTALIDMIIPLKPVLYGYWIFPVYFFSIALLIYIIARYRKEPLVLFGLIWAIIAIFPVIFFATEHWYDPLPSRYTYVARIGIIMVIAGIVSHHIMYNTSRRVINWFAFCLCFAVFLQIIYMVNVVKTEYGYVYASGRTLFKVAQEIKEVNPVRVFVAWERPFTSNTAHIVGVLELVAEVFEKNVIFLKSDEKPCNQCKGVYLFWNESERSYKLKKLL